MDFDFLKAKDRLKNIINKTNLIYSDHFSKISHNNVYIKPENLQKTGSFKIRGAYNKIVKLTKEEKKNGIITASAGNHAQGVAFSSMKENIKSTIVMPESTPMIKVDGTLKFGAKVELYGSTFDDAKNYAIEKSKTEHMVFIPPFDDYDVIEGQGTIALEILEELGSVDYVIVPVGGGGLISGISMCMKQMNPYVKIIGVEPLNASSMQQALKENNPISLDNVDTIADGTAVKKVGDLTFDLSSKFVDDWISISEDEILESFIELLEKHKLIAEPSGVLSIAAIKKLRFYNKNVVCVVSGGNIDMSFISTLIKRGLYASHRIFKFSVELYDSPGKLVDLLNILAKTKANILSINHNSLTHSSRLKTVDVEITIEINGKAHLEKIKEMLYNEGIHIK